MREFLWISTGAVAGANARYWLGAAMARWLGGGFPWATLVVNLSGCLLAGFLAQWLSLRHPAHAESVRLACAVGFLGSYTTFSAFSIEAMALSSTGQFVRWGGYLVASIAGGLLLAYLGARIALWQFRG